jgi:cytochrome P450
LVDVQTTDRVAAGARVPTGPRGNVVLGCVTDVFRDPLRFVLDVAGAHGDVASYRVAHVRMYQINSPQGVQRVLHDNHRNYSKDVATFETLRSIAGNGLFTSDGSSWLRQRRLMQPAFHRRRVAAFGELMTDATQSMLERWRPRVAEGRPIDVAAEFTRLTLEVVTRALFSVSVDSEVDRIGRAITVLLNDVTFRFTFPFYPPLKVPTPRNRRFLAARATLDRIVYGIIADRRRDPGEHDDLLAVLMEARDEETGEGMSDRQLRDEVITLFIAGHETTANALTWAAYLLSTHAGVGRLLRTEVDETLGDRVPTVADVPELTYTRMVLDETLRLYPPVWVTDRKAVEADVVCGYRIPAGVTVAISPYAVHHDPKLWENPEGFDPERFAPENSAGRPHYAYFPFGGGPHQCIGKGFALLETTLVLALLAGRYRLDLVPGRRVEPVASATLRPRAGVWMMACPRSGRG